MDLECWGRLQHYIGLERVYTKLPLREFFQLRLVCKEWNRLAGDSKFLEESFKDHPIPEPFFCLQSYLSSKTVLWAYERTSGLWSSTHNLPRCCRKYTAVEGLLYSYDVRERSQLQVFNIHTRVRTVLPPSPEDTTNSVFHGMYVDKSVKPYTWKIIKGSEGMSTQVYDSRSNSWTTTSSQMFHVKYNAWYYRPSKMGEACSNGVVYILCDYEIAAYVMETDVWISLPLPPVKKSRIDDIGAWQGRVFTVSFSDWRRLAGPSFTVGGRRKLFTDEHHTISVWELVGMGWREFSCIPAGLFCWLNYKDACLPGEPDLEIRASYCEEYILIYTWLHDTNLTWLCKVEAERLVLFNLVSKAWTRIQVPSGAIILNDPTRANRPS